MGDETVPVHVDVVALALGQVDAPERAAMAVHLVACATCRSEYDELTAAVAEVVAAAPEVQPPIGFDQRVLGRLGVDLALPRRRTAQRGAWWAAAAAVVIIAAAVATWSLRSDAGSPAATRALTTLDGGDPVGTVSFGHVDDESIMVVALVDPPAGLAYRCRTTFADGSTTMSEPWPSVRGAWIVALDGATAADVHTVELVVDGTDHVWSAVSINR